MNPLAAEKGGILLVDQGHVFPGAIKEVFQKVGLKFIKGQFNDILKVSSPAKIHAHLSLLQLTALDCGYFGTHLLRAATTPDPAERLKWLVGFCIGG